MFYAEAVGVRSRTHRYWFLETNIVIACLDKVSRNEDVQLKLEVPDCYGGP